MSFWQNISAQLILRTNEFWIVEIHVLPTIDDHLQVTMEPISIEGYEIARVLCYSDFLSTHALSMDGVDFYRHEGLDISCISVKISGFSYWWVQKNIGE